MDFKKIEKKWQQKWSDNLYRADDKSKKEKKYILVEFPYPSGSGLHIGHAFTFTGGDVYARFKRMQGYNVLFPMGWDAFGLPTENYAIKMKRKPSEVTKENTEMFKKQMKELAFSFDWSREINTTDPNYYKWTQWIFIKLFEKGLAYKQEMPINWCPSCKIGLANEEVVNGKCERCGVEVSRRNISQWVVKITKYADRLIEGLKETAFIDKVKAAQVNWIGKSQGITIDYPLVGKEGCVSCYSTRPDTNFGTTFIVVAPEHPKLKELVTPENEEVVKKYVAEVRKKSELERTDLEKIKTGVFTGSYAMNRLSGKKMPIWVADFAILTSGTGMVVGVPAHDKRDWDFAKKYNLEMIPVIKPKGDQQWDYDKEPYLDIDDAEVFNSDFLNGMLALEAKDKVIDYLVEKGWGKRAVNYHLRDWIFSRQHYWGEPIPMIFCAECAKNQKSQATNNKSQINQNFGWQPVPEDQLPVKLPEVEAYEPTDDGQSPLAKMTEWVKTTCPKCGGEARRETDTMPNWAGSDWYYLAYCFANKLGNNKSPTTAGRQETNNNDMFIDIFSDSKKELEYWLPVDVYVGGDEHNTLHLLYSRFIHQFLFDLGLVPTPEPYYKRLSHGVILGPDGQRMSKSRGNVVVPDQMVAEYGVDVVRMYLMFMGPFTGTMVWNEKTLMGVKRFLDKFEKLITNYQLRITNDSSRELKVIINRLIEGVTKDLESFGFNTTIAKLMQALNEITNNKSQITKEEIKTLIKLMAPMAPYLAEELWSKVGEGSVHVADWPVVDAKYLVEDQIQVPVAVNGRVRDQLLVNSDQSKEEILSQAKGLEKIRKWIEGKEIVKEVYIPGRMVNLVIK